MTETRYIQTYQDGVLIDSEPYEVSDEELQVEQAEAETKEANDNALAAYNNWDSLNQLQKDRVLKGLLGDFISRHRNNYIPG